MIGIRIIIILTFFLFLNCNNNNDLFLKELLIHEEKINYTEVFFNSPDDFDLDDMNNLYVSDQSISSILKIYQNGDISNIGRKGRGPGEFNLQLGIAVNEDRLFVNDQGNMRFQILDTLGNYIDSFLYNNPIKNFYVQGEKIYANKQRSGVTTNNENDYKLITVFNFKGEIINEFGNHIDLFENFPLDASHCLIKIYNEMIYVLFVYFPILRVYDLTGNLLNEHNLQELWNYKNLIMQNYAFDTYKNPMIRATRFLFRSFDVSDDGIYIGLFSNDLVIDHIDFHGNHKARYINSNVSDNFYLHSFKKINKKLFFLIEDDGYKIVISDNI